MVEYERQQPPAKAENALPPAMSSFSNARRYHDFGDFMASLPSERPLAALDVGTGGGEFCSNLPSSLPGRFSKVVGIDAMGGSNEKSAVGATSVEILRNTKLEDYASDPENAGRFDLVFLNSPSDRVWPQCLRQIRKVLGKGGSVVYSGKWNMAVTSLFNAFDEPSDVRRYYDGVAAVDFSSAGYETSVIDNHDGYPKANELRVPGLIVATPKSRPGLFPGMSEKEVDAVLAYTMEGKATVQITRGCSRNCLICGVDAPCKGITHMPYPLVKETMKLLKARGVTEVYLYMGNEPLDYRDREHGKDLADILADLHGLGMKTALTTHGWNRGNKRAEEAAKRVAALPFPVDMTVSIHPFHRDILEAKTDEEFKAAVEGHIRDYDAVLEAFAPKKPQVRILGTGLEDAEAGREIPRAKEAQKILADHVHQVWRWERKDVSGIDSTNVIWMGRAHDLLERYGLPEKNPLSQSSLVAEQPITVLTPEGGVEFVFARQPDRRFEPVGALFSGPADPEFKPFMMVLQKVLASEVGRRKTMPAAFDNNYVAVLGAADIKALKEAGADVEVGDVSSFVMDPSNLRLGADERTVRYLHDALYFRSSKEAPAELAALELTAENLAKAYGMLSDMPVPLVLEGKLLSSDMEDAESITPHSRTIWDYAKKAKPDRRGTMKTMEIGTFADI